MKNFKLTFLLFGVIGIMAFSCERGNEECNEVPVPVEIIELQHQGSDTLYWLQNVPNDSQVTNLIINSQADYQKYIAYNVLLPIIDFDKYTLLAGRIGRPNTDFLESQSVYEACNEFTYNVIIARGPATSPIIVYFFAIIPKTTSPITFTITIH